MSKTSSSDTVTVNKATLLHLIQQYNQAVAYLAYARGVRDTLSNARVLRSNLSIIDCATAVDTVEAALYDYIDNNCSTTEDNSKC